MTISGLALKAIEAQYGWSVLYLQLPNLRASSSVTLGLTPTLADVGQVLSSERQARVLKLNIFSLKILYLKGISFFRN